MARWETPAYAPRMGNEASWGDGIPMYSDPGRSCVYGGGGVCALSVAGRWWMRRQALAGLSSPNCTEDYDSGTNSLVELVAERAGDIAQGPAAMVWRDAA
eukprot:6470275-Amphidinium_carterae.1